MGDNLMGNQTHVNCFKTRNQSQTSGSLALLLYRYINVLVVKKVDNLVPIIRYYILKCSTFAINQIAIAILNHHFH